jgi:hypothetical protein
MATSDRVPLGQNTPLTCVWASGFEFQDYLYDEIAATISSPTYNSGTVHTRGGFGGSYSLFCNINDYAQGNGFPALTEFVSVAAVYKNTGNARLIHTYSSGTNGLITSIQNDGSVSAIRFSTTLATTAPGEVPTTEWSWIHTHGKIDNTTGFYNIRVGTYANSILSGSGVDTQQGGASNNNTDAFKVESTSGNNYFDDCAVYARSIYYTGGSGGGGAPVVGNTLTDGTTGATCTIDYVKDDGAGNGVVFISSLAVASFGSGNTISDGSGWTATASNSLADDEDSLWVKELFMIIARPDSDVTTNWTSSTGANHYTEVDDDATEADYISSDTAAQLDQFGTTVSKPSGTFDIQFVMGTVWAQQNGGSVNQINIGYEDDTAVEDADDNIALTGSFDVHSMIWTKNSRTGADWTEAQIDALELRVTTV